MFRKAVVSATMLKDFMLSVDHEGNPENIQIFVIMSHVLYLL